MTPCTCYLCFDVPAPRAAGQCHGYDDGKACCRSATLGDLLCHVHAREQSQAVRSFCREMAPRVRA